MPRSGALLLTAPDAVQEEGEQLHLEGLRWAVHAPFYELSILFQLEVEFFHLAW